jgi:HSP20 family protein
MTNMIRRDPFTDLRSTMDRLFDEGFSRPWRFINSETYEASMPVEVSETDSELVVKASLPGVSPDEVDVTVNNDVLTIKGEHKETTEDGKREFYRREIRYGAFNRSFTLPVKVDADQAEANYENGVLTLRLPKAASIRPKQIKVGVGATPAVASGTSNGSSES